MSRRKITEIIIIGAQSALDPRDSMASDCEGEGEREWRRLRSGGVVCLLVGICGSLRICLLRKIVITIIVGVKKVTKRRRREAVEEWTRGFSPVTSGAVSVRATEDSP